MYYPYFRGKQYELITVRECAPILARSGFTPIIEPVKELLNGLTKALDAVNEVNGAAIVIVNPSHGDLSHDGSSILELLQNEYADSSNIHHGLVLTEETSLVQVLELYETIPADELTFIHAGFADAKPLVERIGNGILKIRHIFMDDKYGKLYQKHFRKAQRVLLRDGFEKRTNRKHPDLEFFSDLHATFEEEGMNGFGDFLIVGDDYSETGGPAYAVAIHITFIDPDRDDEMYVHHFKSDRQDDPKDPAGKFAEALEKLMQELNRPGCKILRTEAMEEFVELYKRGHFPGLGYVKKLSMKHHIETLADYFSE